MSTTSASEDHDEAQRARMYQPTSEVTVKIIDIIIRKATMENGTALVASITMEDGKPLESVVAWNNTNGLWASDADARDPAEIAAYLRAFAGAIERATAENAKAA